MDNVRIGVEKNGVNVMLKLIEKQNQELKEKELRIHDLKEEMKFLSFSISHDLRAPIRRIKAYIEIIQEDLGESLPEENQEMMDFVSQGCDTLNNQIKAIMTFGKIGQKELSYSKVNPNDCIEDVLSRLRSDGLYTDIDLNQDTFPDILTDEKLFHDLMYHLLSNAIKFCNPGEIPIVGISATYCANEVTFCIKDQGIGFEERLTKKLFKLFSVLHHPANFPQVGMGAGLACAKKIVERLHGEISAHSIPGKGSEFTFRIPIQIT